jgi:antitoxin Phd
MERLKTADVRKHLSDVLNRVNYQGQRIVLCRRNKELGALVSMDDLRLLQEIEDAEDAKAARRVLKRVKSGRERVLALEEADAELG